MFRNRLYYRFKPYLPQQIRMAVRRQMASRKRQQSAGVWPILPGSEKPPAGWKGWPNGKKFALVLTHDVEGHRGLDRCRQLMNLEKNLGVRSSFNLIPEGDYRAPADLRSELKDNGFEIGVHDFRHDGKLYRSREEFSRNATRINNYLKDWGAVGFRSGFMLHNLNWLHDLNIQYDASTFDTDPFEPQPDGLHTIFPFWVPRPSAAPNSSLITHHSSLVTPDSPLATRHSSPREGYVELPYTLAQDSTLFLLFREPNFDVWRKKLDWLVQQGGMALLDTHPDYMSFNGSVRRSIEYPASHYADFIRYIQEHYRDQFWLTTPSEIAQWYRANLVPANPPDHQPRTSKTLIGKKAAVLLYSYYPSDPRPRRAAEALVESGMEVDMICLRQKEDEPIRETINGVNVRRIPMRRRRNSKLTYVLQYGSFIAACGASLARRSFLQKYDLVHVHNMPDVLVFSGMFPKLRGARLILDQHDPMPELMRTIFDLEEHSFAVRVLKSLEKASIGFVDQVITVNLACKKIFSARSCREEKIQVVMNAPDERIFKFTRFEPAATRTADQPFILMYHGSIVERHGLDLAVQAVAQLRKTIPGIELRIYGSRTPFLDSVMETVVKLDLEKSVRYLGSKNLEQIAEAIRESDLGIIPNRRSVFTEINTPTRIFEYLAVGKPVIAPRVPGITDYFQADDLIFFQLGDADDLARQIEHTYRNFSEIRTVVERGQAIYQKHCWTREREEFVNRVETLLRNGDH